MGWEVDPDGIMCRDVTIFSDAIHKAKQVGIIFILVKSLSHPSSIYLTDKLSKIEHIRKFTVPYTVNFHF